MVVAAETGGALGGMVRQLSIDQFENEGRRVSYGTPESATAARKLLDRQMSISSVPKKVKTWFPTRRIAIESYDPKCGFKKHSNTRGKIYDKKGTIVKYYILRCFLAVTLIYLLVAMKKNESIIKCYCIVYYLRFCFTANSLVKIPLHSILFCLKLVA